MSRQSQEERANRLLSLHTGGDLLLLPNVWNPIGARILESKGFPAVATASAALSASLGFRDGEKLKRSTLIEFTGRIARSVDVPVTADIEAGYGTSLAELRETVRQVIDARIVGINLEDSIGDGGALRPVVEQCQRISAVREVAAKSGIHLVINARVDCFLSTSFPDKTEAMREVTARARAYSESGADCIYPVGPGDETTVRMLRERIQSPINILAAPGAAPLSTLKEIGVNRVSFGPCVFRACLRRFLDIVEGLHSEGNLALLSNILSGEEVREYLPYERESELS